MSALARLVLCFCAAILLAACAATPLQPMPGGGISEDGLQRLSGTTFDEVWARPGARLGAYPTLFLEPASVSYREVDDGIHYESPRLRGTAEGFPIPAGDQTRIEQRFQERIAAALDGSSRFRRTAAAAPGALTLRAQLVDFVSRVPPEGAFGRTEVYVTSVGEATLLVELWDGERNELLARAIDHRRVGPPGAQLIRANRVTSWAEIDRQMQRMAADLRHLVDELYRLEGARPTG